MRPRSSSAASASPARSQRLGQIPLGGTATGTGLNTHPEFAERVRQRLAADTGLPISAPLDRFEAQANRDSLVEDPVR